MKNMHVKVDQVLCEESRSDLREFLGGLEGVESIEVGRADIDIRYDERTIPDEQVFAMMRSTVEMLGCHLSYA
jgi:copper chaperone CopZ